MVRAAEDRLRVADLHDPPEVENGDPVGEVADDAEVVRDQQVARPSLGLELGEQVEDRGLDRDVERARRLVGDDDPRVAGERPGDRQPLLEAAGQLARLEVEVALGEAQVRGQLVDPLVDGLALEPGELADRARQDVAGGPAAIERRVGVLEDHLEGALVLRRPAARLGRQGVLIELDRAARVRPLDAQDRPGQGRLARARLADEPEGLAVAQLQGDADQRRHVVAALVEGLRHAFDGQRDVASDGVGADDRRRLDHLAEPVDVVATRPLAVADLDDRRHHGPAQLVGELAAIDEHAGRQVRADLRQVARDRRQRPLGLAHAAARERAQQPEGVRMLRIGEDGRRVAFLDDLAGVHHADPIAQRPDDAEVVGDQQDRRVRLGLELAHEVEDARLDRGIEAGRRFVEDQQLRVGGERDGDDDALLHPAGQLVRVAVGDGLRVGDLHALERPHGALLGLLRALAEDRERLGDLRPDLGRRVEGRAGVLVDHRDVVDPELADLLVATSW